MGNLGSVGLMKREFPRFEGGRGLGWGVARVPISSNGKVGPVTEVKPGLHPRNRHAAGYDFPALVAASPELARFVRPSPAGRPTVDFADPAAVLALNRALLRCYHGIREWELPPGSLCPPIPGRLDYLHHLADLLAGKNGPPPRGPEIAVLDLGTGANVVYPILGVSEYGWRFVGTEVAAESAAWAERIVAANPGLAAAVEIRRVARPEQILRGVAKPGETFAAAMCNPPFHASPAEAAAGTARKVRNLNGGKTPAAGPVLNFGGRGHELWCPGGEVAFVRRMIAQSAEQPELCRWFTTLVSSRESLPAIEGALRDVRAAEVRIIPVAQGQKRTRIVAWRFGAGP